MKAAAASVGDGAPKHENDKTLTAHHRKIQSKAQLQQKYTIGNKKGGKKEVFARAILFKNQFHHI